MKAIPIFFVLVLAGCQCVNPDPQIVQHDVPIPVPCKIAPIQKPVLPFTDNGSTTDSIFVKVKKAVAELDIRQGYEDQLEAAVKACQ